MMINLLIKFCENNNFVVNEIVLDDFNYSLFLAVPHTSSGNQEYFLILESPDMNDETISKLESEDSERILEYIEKNSLVDESFKKNCTLLLCCLDGAVSERERLKFEESPYYFKKNVIHYSDNEISSLSDALDNDFSNDKVNELLVADSGQSFELFKSNAVEIKPFYPLLMRMTTKLPFIHYIPSSNQLGSIERFVGENLIQSELELLDLICRESPSDSSMDELIRKEFLSNE
jgi:hypothetical protein